MVILPAPIRGVLFMLPRLSSPQFGLFDDGKTIISAREMAKDIIHFTFEAGEGCFRPVCWLYFSAIHWIFGEHPFWFFLGNTVLLFLSIGMLMMFTLLLTGRRYLFQRLCDPGSADLSFIGALGWLIYQRFGFSHTPDFIGVDLAGYAEEIVGHRFHAESIIWMGGQPLFALVFYG